MAIQPKRFGWALLIGFTLGLLPYIAEMLFPPAGAPQPLRAVAYALSYPGYLIALAFAGGRVDDINFFVLSLANVAIYWIVGYFIITLVDRLTHKNINRAT